MRIFLDMDGVLANFEGHYAKLYGADSYTILYQDRDKFRANGASEEDALQQAEELFVNRIKQSPTYWKDIDPYPWAKGLYTMCTQLASTYVLTAIMPEDLERTIAHKLWWNKEILANEDRILFTTSSRDSETKRHHSNKSIWCLSPYDVLIDDSDSNLNTWPGVRYKFDPKNFEDAPSKLFSELSNIKGIILDAMTASYNIQC